MHTPNTTRCRFLYLVGQLGPGELEHQLYYLLQAMDRERYRPEVVVWRFRDDDVYVSKIRKLNVPLHFFPETVSAGAKVLAFRRLIARIQPEVVHSCSFYTNIAAWAATVGTEVIAIGAVQSELAYEKKLSGSVLGSLSARWPTTPIL